MDANIYFEKRHVGGITIYECKECKKNIVLRSGSIAVTRLLSHVIQVHGIVPPDPKQGTIPVRK